ncbi:MAG TPA: ABC transporter permease [Terriglobia bacterium]|jgi:putative ABC transport system permease protein
MLRSELWRVSFDALRANKLKAFLTMLGVVIGSACIVLVVTISLLGQSYIVKQIEGVGSNIVWAELHHSQASTLSDEITEADMDAVRGEVPNVVEVAGTREVQMSVVAGAIERPVTLVAVTAGFQKIRNLLVVAGRYFDIDDFQTKSKVCLLTDELARVVFAGTDPVGQVIRVGELRFTVIGVFKERISTFGQSEITRETIIVPFGLLKSYADTGSIKTLYAQAASPDDVPAVTRGVNATLLGRHRQGSLYDVDNLTSILDAARKITFALLLVLLAVGLITLIISGVGIMNIMLVTVSERTREIGVRKAIGAAKREILFQFLLEALMISGTGAVLGILIALSIPILVQPFLPEGLTIPISGASVIVAFVVSCLTGVIFGYLPASRAARLQPTEALRHE